MNLENQGAQPMGAGTNTGSFAFALNDLINPFSKTGALAVGLPGLVIAGQNAQFLKNILVNTTTNTGIYNQYRIWSTAVTVTYTPGNAADSVNTVMVPLASASVSYSSFEAMSTGSNSVSGASTFGSSAAGSTMSGIWSMPALAGVPKNLFPAFSSSIGTFAASPGLQHFLQVAYRTDNNAVLTAVVGIRVQIAYHVEFFTRADAVALV